MDASKVRELQQQIDESRALIGKASMLLDEADATLAQLVEVDGMASQTTTNAKQPPIFRLHT